MITMIFVKIFLFFFRYANKFNSVLQYIFSYLLETGLDNFTFEKSFEKYVLPSKKCIRPRRKNDNAREEYEWPKPRSASGKYK